MDFSVGPFATDTTDSLYETCRSVPVKANNQRTTKYVGTAVETPRTRVRLPPSPQMSFVSHIVINDLQGNKASLYDSQSIQQLVYISCICPFAGYQLILRVKTMNAYIATITFLYRCIECIDFLGYESVVLPSKYLLCSWCLQTNIIERHIQMTMIDNNYINVGNVSRW